MESKQLTATDILNRTIELLTIGKFSFLEAKDVAICIQFQNDLIASIATQSASSDGQNDSTPQ